MGIARARRSLAAIEADGRRLRAGWRDLLPGDLFCLTVQARYHRVDTKGVVFWTGVGSNGYPRVWFKTADGRRMFAPFKSLTVV